MSGLVEFLRARLAEDEAQQQDSSTRWHRKDCEAVPDVLYPDRETGECDCGVPARILAETEAKQKLLAEYAAADARANWPDFDGGVASGLEMALQHLTAPFSGHPDYREEWKP
jgi:hypothetical protein